MFVCVVFSYWLKRDITAFHGSVLSSIYLIDIGTMIFRAEMRFNKIVPVYMYMVDEPSTKVVIRKNELSNEVSRAMKDRII